MMSVTQESVKSAFYMLIPGVCRSQGKISDIICNKLILAVILPKFLFYFHIFVMS